jgi:hypothetical protein
VRPAYETDGDRRAEARVASVLAERWGARARKLPTYYPVDWLLSRNDPDRSAWVEIKRRYVSSVTYPYVILSLHKCLAMKDLAWGTAAPAFAVFGFDDAIMYVEASGIDVSVGNLIIAGRTDRQDCQDQEPCAKIPQSSLRLACINWRTEDEPRQQGEASL